MGGLSCDICLQNPRALEQRKLFCSDTRSLKPPREGCQEQKASCECVSFDAVMKVNSLFWSPINVLVWSWAVNKQTRCKV